MALQNELRSNQRLRIGLALVVSILLLYGLLEWRDYGDVQKAQYRQAASQVVRLGHQRAQVQWPERASQAQAALKSAEATLWHQSSLSLAQAELQDSLYTSLRQADAKSYSVKLADSSAKLGVDVGGSDDAQAQGLTPMHARLSFNADTPVLLALLSGFVQSGRPLVVDSLSLKAQRVEMAVSAWYAGPPASAPAPAISAPQ